MYILIFGIISFVIFDSVNLESAFSHIGAMVGFGAVPVMTEATAYYLGSYLIVFVLAVFGATPIPKKLTEKMTKYKIGGKITQVLEPILMMILLAVATGYLVDGSFNPFLYFRF